MKASELRIGNLVNYYNEIIKLHHLEKILIKKIKPIKLTEEWLLKFGAIEWILEDHCLTLDLGKINIVFNVLNETTYIDVDLGIKIYTDHIKHVHQLQNLYFTLTGNELTYENTNYTTVHGQNS